MKKTILSTAVMAVVCISGCMSAYAVTQASGDEDNPTVLTLNQSFDSYLYTGHPADYYTFTLSSAEKVIIECDNVSKTKEYYMTLSGNNIEPIYTTDATDNYSMYITATLSAGTYNVSVTSGFESRAIADSASYSITVYDEINNSGYIVNSADRVKIDDDFEDGDTSNWLDGFRPHYVYGNKTIESETNGNNYVAFTPVDSSQYYIFEASDVYSTEVLCSEFDIKFPSGNMEIQARDTDSNLSVDFNMAGRIRKFAYYLQYYSNGEWKYMLDNTNNWLQINNTSKWYTMRITFDVRTNKYNIYLEDRDSGDVISSVTSADFGETSTKISYYAFSSTEKVCLDNVKIFSTSISDKVNGHTYIRIPKMGNRQYRYFNINSLSDKAWSADQWSISSTTQGVTIDADTGILTLTPEAKPGSAIITVYRKYYPWIKATYFIDIDR